MGCYYLTADPLVNFVTPSGVKEDSIKHYQDKLSENLKGEGMKFSDPAEVFTFACTQIFDGPGSFTNVAVGHGIDNLGRDVTVCAPGSPTTGKFCDARETDTKTVAVTVTVSGGK